MAGQTSVSAALDRLRALASQGQGSPVDAGSPASGQRRSLLGGRMVTAPLVDTSDSPTRKFPQVTPPWARAPGAAATSPNSAAGTPRSPSLRSGASTPSSLAPTLGRRPGSASRGSTTAVRPGGPLQRRTHSNPDIVQMAAPSDLVSRAMAGYDSQTPTGQSPTGSAVLPSLPPVPASEAPSDIVARALAKYGAAKEVAPPAPEVVAPTTRDSGFFPPQAYGAAPEVEKGPRNETFRSPQSPEDLLTPVPQKEDSPPGSPPVSDGGSHHGSVGSESTAFPGSVRGASEDPVKEPLPKLGKALQVEEVQQQQQEAEAVLLEAQRVAAEKKVAEIMAEEPAQEPTKELTQEPDIHDSWLPSERLRWRGADRQLPREQRLFAGPRHVVLTAALAFGLAAAGASLGHSQANPAFVQRGRPAGMQFLAKPRPRAGRRV